MVVMMVTVKELTKMRGLTEWQRFCLTTSKPDTVLRIGVHRDGRIEFLDDETKEQK